MSKYTREELITTIQNFCKEYNTNNGNLYRKKSHELNLPSINTIRRIFGSWNKALTVCDISILKIDPNDLKRICANPDCKKTFTVDRPSNEQKFHNSSCAAHYNNKTRKINYKKQGNTLKNNLKKKKEGLGDYVKLSRQHDPYNEVWECPVSGIFLNYYNKPFVNNKWCKMWKHQKATVIRLCDIFDIQLKQKDTLQQLDEAFETLRKLYEDDKNSAAEIAEKYPNHFNSDAHVFLKAIGIKRRSLKQAVSNSFQTGRMQPPKIDNQYNTGYHIDWEGIEHYYRSSYELEYYKKIDILQLSYETEKYHFTYYDTQLNQIRTAIPDIVIKDTNTIYEIKSYWTYNKQEMFDKLKSYVDNGYNFKLILEGIEYDYLIEDKLQNSYNLKNNLGPYKLVAEVALASTSSGV